MKEFKFLPILRLLEKDKMAIIPQTQHYGDIEVVDILVYFNEPILFQGLSGDNKNLFCMLVSDDDDINKWMIIESSSERTDEILTGTIDLYTSFRNSENGHVVMVDVDPYKNMIIYESMISVKEIIIDWLPDKGLVFNGEALSQKEVYLEENWSNNKLTFHLNFAEAPAGQAPIKSLGNIFTTLQSVLDSISQTIIGTPTVVGGFKKAITDLSALNLEAMSMGSTIIDLVPTHGPTLLSENADIIEEFIKLVNATASEDQLTQVLSRLKVRVASNYLHFLSTISTQTKPLYIEFIKAGSREPKCASVEKEDIARAIKIIDKMDFSEPELQEIVGTLEGMDRKKGTFHLHPLVGEGIVSEIVGDIDKNLLDNLTGTQIGYMFKFTLKKVTKVKKFASDEMEVYELIGLQVLSEKNE